MAPGWKKRKTPPDGGVGAPMIARLEPYRPRCRAGVGTLAASHQVAGRFAGPEPSAPLWILLPAHYMNGRRLGQAVASDQFKQIHRATCRPSAATCRPCATCWRCPPASRTRATPAAASAPATSCARAASTSARPPASTAAAHPTCHWAPGRRAGVQTEPLREPTEVTGPIEVHPWVVTTAVDTDFTAKLIDVLPAECVVSAGVCAEPDRQHRAAPLPQQPRAGGTGQGGRARGGDEVSRWSLSRS